MSDLPSLIVVSLKMYLGVVATRAWVADIAEVAARLLSHTCREVDGVIIVPT